MRVPFWLFFLGFGLGFHMLLVLLYATLCRDVGGGKKGGGLEVNSVD